MNKLQKLPVPLFYWEILDIWSKQLKDINKELIWNNKFVLVNGFSVFYKSFLDAGIWYVTDLFAKSNNLKVVPFSYWLSRGLLQKHFMLWRGLISACRSRFATVEVPENGIFEIKMLKVNKNVLSLKSKDFYNMNVEKKFEFTSKKFFYIITSCRRI
jgi:hypothetical protein